MGIENGETPTAAPAGTGAGPPFARIAVYAALGLVLLLLGVRALGGGEAEGSAGGGLRLAGAGPASGGRGGAGDVVVHAAGAVRDPGVYRLPAGSRVADLLRRAGGARSGGDPDGINLAAPLADGQQVVVPRRARSGASASAAGASAAADGPISLGAATAADLEAIDGIGPVTAGKIIAFRDERGGVAGVEELDAIPGIGPATIEALQSRLQP